MKDTKETKETRQYERHILEVTFRNEKAIYPTLASFVKAYPKECKATWVYRFKKQKEQYYTVYDGDILIVRPINTSELTTKNN